MPQSSGSSIPWIPDVAGKWAVSSDSMKHPQRKKGDGGDSAHSRFSDYHYLGGLGYKRGHSKERNNRNS